MDNCKSLPNNYWVLVFITLGGITKCDTTQTAYFEVLWTNYLLKRIILNSPFSILNSLQKPAHKALSRFSFPNASHFQLPVHRLQSHI